LCPAQLPGAFDPVAAHDVIEINSFPSRIAAKLAIADYLGIPLAKLPQEQLTAIDLLLTQTLQEQDVLAYIRTEIQPTLRR
jgi:hypothetical protein